MEEGKRKVPEANRLRKAPEKIKEKLRIFGSGEEGHSPGQGGSLLAILAGLLLGLLAIVIAGILDPIADAETTWEAVRLLLFGIFSKGRDAEGNLVFGFNGTLFGNMLFKATPLILTGLSVGVSMKVGLFNIGAPGQYLVGAAATLLIALGIPSEAVSPALIWVLALLGGMLAAALWGAVPGAMKAFLNINEVLCCILTNWIAANFVTLLFENSSFRNMTESGKTGFLYKTAVNGVETPELFLDKLFPGSQVNAGFLIALLFALAVFLLMEKTTLGYELKVCGANRDAARYAGIRDRRNIVQSMALAGALAGAGAALYYLSGNTEFYWANYQTLPKVGFNGIPAALLAQCRPAGTVFSGLFLSALEISGQQIANLTPFNQYIADLVASLIIYLSAFWLFIKRLLIRWRKRK